MITRIISLAKQYFAYLKKLDLSKIDPNNYDFSKFNPRNIDLPKIDLSKINLSGISLDRVDIQKFTGNRIAVVVTIGALTLGSANFLSGTVGDNSFSEAYPAGVCAPNLPGLISQISVETTTTKFRRVGSTSAQFNSMRASRFPVTRDPILVEGNGVTPIFWQSKAGGWSGAVACTEPVLDQWFIGGTADITTRGKLVLVNSGLSESVVDVGVWGGNGQSLTKEFTVSKNSYSLIPLDSLSPGDQSIAVHVVPRSGRVNSFMVDERGRGLRGLGGDLVNPAAGLSKSIYIPAIPYDVRNKRNAIAQLRVLAPGDADANITVELVTRESRFAPEGLDGQSIPHGIVRSLEFNPGLTTNMYGLIIKSDEPITAAVFSRAGRDFVWSTSAPELTNLKMAMTGLNPVLGFVGGSIAVELEAKLASGKKIRARVKGDDFATWKVPNNVRSVTIKRASPGTHGAALQVARNGVGYFPLFSGSNLSKSSVPNANIRVLNP